VARAAPKSNCPYQATRSLPLAVYGGRRIEKVRYRIPLGKRTIELDIYRENSAD